MPKALVPDVVGSAMAARALVHVGVGEERDDRGGTSADFSCDGDKLICFGWRSSDRRSWYSAGSCCCYCSAAEVE
ncbi:hypothetical protein CLOM_g10265 [Closterium sp. NIES-68]|nr:hypothetical protein CLOM_g10265 [Closterium sp. NIES-68]